MSNDSRETLKSFLNSIGASSNMLSYAPGENDDLGVDPGTGKELVDLPDIDEGLLGDYLKYLLDNAQDGNYFNLTGKNTAMPRPVRGVALEPAEMTGAENVFVESTSPGGLELGRYSNSGKFDASPGRDIDPGSPGLEVGPLSSIVDKKMSVDGHEMYPEIAGQEIDRSGKLFPPGADETDRKIPSRTSAILSGYNRFSAAEERAHSMKDRDTGEKIDPTLGSVQDKLGGFDRETEDIKFKNVKSVGLSLLLKSAGYDNAALAVDSVDPGTFKELLYSDEEFQAGFTNSWEEPGGTVGEALLRAKNAFGAPQKNNNMARLDSDAGRESFGSIYTPYTPFDSVATGPHIAQAVASVKAMVELVRKFEKDVLGPNLDIDPKKANDFTLGKGPLFFGTSDRSINGAYRLLKATAIANVDYAYGDCVDAGIDFLFSEDISGLESVTKTIEKAPLIWTSPGYLTSLARTIVRASANMFNALHEAAGTGFTEPSVHAFMRTLKTSNIMGMLNALAITGNIVIKLQKRQTEAGGGGFAQPWSVDELGDGPATRQAKSRSSDGIHASSMAWRGSSVPSAFLLPTNVIYAGMAMGTSFDGQNPLRGHLGNPIVEKTYFGRKAGTGDVSMDDIGGDWNFLSAEAQGSRIPDIVVRRMEDLLESEYVPFYFHDVRTNEIIGFHAFISTLVDSFSPSYNEIGGYGRVDTVKTWQKTTRNLSLDFYIVATNPEDFDEMWYKINKLTTMCYPQFDPGVLLKAGGHTFTMPFSQIPMATPVTRLRIGDVIKSNYSKFNLARIFGVGDGDVVMSDPLLGSPLLGPVAEAIGTASDVVKSVNRIMPQIFMALVGSPIASLYDPTSAGMRLLGSMATAALKNGFMNPILGLYTKMMKDPDSYNSPNPAVMNLSALAADMDGPGSPGFGYKPGLTGVYLKPSMERPYIMKKGGTFYTGTHYHAEIASQAHHDVVSGLNDYDERSAKLFDRYYSSPDKGGDRKQKTVYTILITDLNAPIGIAFEKVYCTHADLVPNPKGFTRLLMLACDPVGTGLGLVRSVINAASQTVGIPGDEVQSAISALLPATARFMNGNPVANFGAPNPITYAFNTTRGRGLAGVIDKLTFNWIGDTIPWSTDLWSRAPMIAKVSMGFKVIHDIGPGLAHDGYNRAPVYNVGKVMHEICGDVYDDSGAMAEVEFKTARRLLARKGE